MQGFTTPAAVESVAGGSAWSRLAGELARWDAGAAVFWWRDDDAITATPALDTLLEIAGSTPLTLAVVPKRADYALEERLGRSDGRVTIVQHGWSHRDHGRERKAELGPERPAGEVMAELDAGRERLRDLYGARFAPVLVPPWNRIDPALFPALAGRYRGLSTDRPRRQVTVAPGVVQANAQVDLIDWNGGALFVGEEQALDRITAHLTARRAGRIDRAEPTGILTHHLVQDAATSHFLRTLLPFLAALPAVRWAGAHDVFDLS